MFEAAFLAILLGFLLIAIAKGFTPEQQRRRAPATPLDDLSLRLNALPISHFANLMVDLLARMGVAVDTIALVDSGLGGVEMTTRHTREIVGGRLVVHCLRADDTELVGPSPVRNLYQAVKEEGAMKGILFTTGFFADEAIKIASELPLELVDGDRLRELLQKHLPEEVEMLPEVKPPSDETG